MDALDLATDCLLVAGTSAVAALALYAVIASIIDLAQLAAKWLALRRAAAEIVYPTGEPADDAGDLQ